MSQSIVKPRGVRCWVIVGALWALLSGRAPAEQPGPTAASALGHDMVYVPPGEFVMGTSEADAQRLAQQHNVHPTLFLGETPQRQVFVHGFLIDRYPVTHAQYKAFMDATGHRAPSTWTGRDYPEGMEDHPVTGVNWHDADAYARWVGLRLPTEEEWEKAARGPDGRVFPWGNAWRDDATRTDDPSSPQTRPLTTPVGCFPAGASPYGILDLCGNVAEWTSTPAQPFDPTHQWAWYVVKGAGAAITQQYNFRAAARNFSAHSSRWHSWLGFRCAKDASEPPGSEAPARPALAPRSAPAPIPPVQGPRADLYAKEPIRIEVRDGSAGVTLRIPWFPVGHFHMSMPEQTGAQGVALAWTAPHEGIRWESLSDGAWQYECTFPGKARMRVTLVPGRDHVDFTIALRNLSGEPFTGVFSNTCFNPHASPYFEDPERVRTFVWTDGGPTGLLELPIAPRSGEPLHGGWGVAAADQPAPRGGHLVRWPLIGLRSRDGQYVIAQAYAEGTTVANNAHYSCLHSRPRWPDIAPGEECAVTGKVYFLRGGPDELLARWKADFGK